MKNSPTPSKKSFAATSADETPVPEDALFPIVGIGASAGGLEAFSQLLAALPEDIGMAYVLVQHLDPHHESGLSDLLSKVAHMSVEEAAHNTRVVPNHIYVIPPNACMTIAKGVLQLTPRENAPKPFLSIDHFLRSLAEDRQEYALGVVLSGTGTDGTHGLEEIKAVGGIAFAQNEASARHTAMPLSAIQSGCVDFILSPAEIGKELTRIGRHPYLGRAQAETDQALAISEGHYRKIIDLLRTNAGVDFTAYRDTTIKRRILRRMALHAYKGLAEYINLLEHKPDEVKELYHDLLINVTSFFREPDTFEALKSSVFPKLLEEKDSSSELRFWVAGCSTGQEAYSLAMALLEFLDGKNVHPRVQIFATDLSDERSLAKAREGLYPKNIESDVSPARLQRFFTKEDNECYRISKQIREMCLFAKHNVAADPPFSKMDLISCRNLLIYLAPPLQKRVIPTFHYALNPGGFLLLGASETVGSHTDMFAVVDQKRRIYARKPVVIREYPHFTVKDFQMGKMNRTGLPASTSADWQREADRIVLNKYTPPGVLVNENLDILQFRGRTSPYLESPSGEPSHNLMRMACEGLFPALRKAIDDCRRQNTAITRPGVQIRRNGELSEIEIQVIPVPLPNAGEKCFLVLFEASAAPAAHRKTEDNTLPEPDETVRLRQELASLHEYLQSIVEQKDTYNEELQASNEAILSNNEEMQSANEELETAKEELQSINEELNTVNEQLGDRNKELNRVNIELQASRDYAQAIVDTVREPLIILDGDLRVQKASESFYRDFEVDPKQTENRFFYALGNGQWDIPELRQLLEKILPEKLVLKDYSIRHTFSGIGSKVMLLNGRRLMRKDAEPLILVAIEDVTERTWIEDELRHSTRQMSDADHRKDEFLAMLAHELRNPLAPIHNALQVMELPDTSADMVSEARAIIRNQLNQMIRLVDDLLDVSRITSGKIELRLERVELATVVQNAIETSRPLMEAASHKLNVSLPEESVWLEADPIRLAQVLGNLLNNAAKYTKKNGRIELSAERRGNEVLIHVKDNGIGISADMLPRIFGLFSQVDNSIDRAQGGLGIGLALVKTLVELHSGSVKVRSEGIGRGSKFTVCLPLASPPKESKKLPAQKKKSSSKKTTGKRILVVDDNENSAKTMGWMLELMFGHTVERAHDGKSTIAAAKHFLPDLILLDIGLPGMSGYEICHTLRQEPSLNHTKIVALTGWGQQEHRQLSKEAGFDAHLVKPVAPEVLQDLLESLEEKPESEKLFHHA